MTKELLPLANGDMPLDLKVKALQKENRELKMFNDVFVQTLRYQGDWKQHYQELSKEHLKLRSELEKWQKRKSPIELALLHDWGRPIVYRRELTDGFAERELGEYLWYQLDLLESGLRFCGEQVPCGNSFVDIVAEDRYNKHVLVELKVVEDDRRLCVQVAKYPKAYADQYKVCLDSIRMVVLAPNYGDLLKRELEMSGVTLYKYEKVAGWIEVSSIYNRE